MIDDIPSIICGFPSVAEDYREDNLDFNSYLNINRPSVYALRAKGNSMVKAGIFENDILIVDKALRPENGQIVVACIDGQFTLKRIYFNPLRLCAENDDYPDIFFSSYQEMVIFGTLTSVVRKL